MGATASSVASAGAVSSGVRSSVARLDDFYGIEIGSEDDLYGESERKREGKQKEKGGRTSPVFSSKRDSHLLQDKFVVWVGRSIGIMSEEHCMFATQRLANAKWRGPMFEEAASELWGKKMSVAKVVDVDEPRNKP